MNHGVSASISLVQLILAVALAKTAYTGQLQEMRSCPACKKTAKYFLMNMNQSADPCVDFYNFACGNFIKNAQIPRDKDRVDLKLLLKEEIMTQLKDGILKLTTVDGPESFRKLRSYYDTCIHQVQSGRSINDDYHKILAKMGGWPVLQRKSWNGTKFDWRESMYKFLEMGYPYDFFVNVIYTQDLENSNARSLYVGETQLSYPHWFLLQDRRGSSIQAYFTYMVDVAIALGADRERAKFDLGKVLDFEIEVAKRRFPEDEKIEVKKINNRMTLAQLQALAPDVPWLDHVNRLFWPYLKFGPKDYVIVTNPPFVRKFVELLHATPRRVQANYAMWRLTQKSLSYLQSIPEVKQAVDTFRRALNMAVDSQDGEVEPQWHKCVTLVSQRMFLATAAVYVRNHFDRDSKDDATILFDNIRWSLHRLIPEISWMSQDTRNRIQSKLSAVGSEIGYPDELLNDTALDRFHDELEINRESFWMTELNYNRWFERLRFEQYSRPVDKHDWTGQFGEDVTVPNAAYDAQKNIIRFPAGILQATFFDKGNPKYVNYGSIGSAMGHEMVHAIDEKGNQFDTDGNLSHDIWDSITRSDYSKRAQCFIGQYNNFLIEEIGYYVNGRKTAVENIADTVGLLAAYGAYSKWSESRKAESPLPGLEKYNARQLFWLANANSWCSKEQSSVLQPNLLHDDHSPDRFRVNGPMSNLKEFSRDFECDPGTPMNPSNRCSIF